MPWFTYEPLPLPNEDHIRLATIHSGDFTDDIIISLRTARFRRDDPPLYEALSYAWGSEEDLCHIQARGDDAGGRHGELEITRNLETAIRHLRHVGKPRVVWIDAICIDQHNDVEKGPQVTMMGDLYRLAARVVVWLGPEAEESARAMTFFRALGPQIEIKYLTPTWRNAPPPTSTDLGLPLGQDDIRPVLDLLSRPYFDRLWIRQEIFLADPREAVIVCGTHQVPWLVFRNGVAGLYLLRLTFGDMRGMFETLPTNLYQFIFQPSIMQLDSLRFQAGFPGCKDERDRIYAVLSLLDNKDRAIGIKPDYTRPFNEIFRDVTAEVIRRHNSVAILTECQLNGVFSPSWVPNWSEKSKTRVPIRPVSSASSNIASSFQFAEPNTLRLAGVLVSTIRRMHGAEAVIPEEIAGTRSLSSFRCLLNENDMLSRYVDGGTILTAYAVTLLFGRFREAREPPSGHQPSLEECKDLLARIFSGAECDGMGDRKLLHTLEHRAAGRRLFEGTGGFLGIAPSQAEEGDEICVFLGCHVPLVIRPTGEGKFRVVGECYVPGVSAGEALLGPLPAGIQAVIALSGDEHYRAFRDLETGSISFEDPRLITLPVDLTGYRRKAAIDPGAFIHVEPDILRQRGIDAKFFDLV